VSGAGETDLSVLLASMSPELHDGSYVFVVDEGRGGREEAVVMVAEAEGTTYRGHPGAREWWTTVRAAIAGAQWEFIDLEEQGAFGVIRVRVSGSIRGVPVEQAMWQAVELRDGKAGWWAFFREEADARAAAGLT